MTASCARMGQPTGGDKDTEPPRVVETVPPDGTTGFSGNKILIRFDEWITLDNPLQKIIISPPPRKKPQIKPAGYAAKQIEIRFSEPLAPQTTYTVFFGDAIRDYHEGNVLENYTYVFSTGDRLDSLRLQGRVVSLPDGGVPEKTVVGLYRAEGFHDSLIYSQPPYYVTRARKDGSFTFEHLAPGLYRLVAFEDQNGNFTYQPGTEKVGFIKAPVRLPAKQDYTVYLFSEPAPFRLESLEERSGEHWVATVQGTPAGIEPVAAGKSIFHYFDPPHWHLWIWPVQKGESFELVWRKQKDTIARRTLQVTAPTVDTLVMKWDKQKLYPVDSIRLLTNIPLRIEDIHQIKIFPWRKGDRFRIDEQGLAVYYPKPDRTRDTISIRVLPRSFRTVTGIVNRDTVSTLVHIIPWEETGRLTVIWKDRPAVPVLAQLTDSKGQKIIRSVYSTEGQRFVFPFLPPGRYRLRFVLDTNRNRRWDNGSWAAQREPEKILFYPRPIEIRANWEKEETFTGASITANGARAMPKPAREH